MEKLLLLLLNVLTFSTSFSMQQQQVASTIQLTRSVQLHMRDGISITLSADLFPALQTARDFAGDLDEEQQRTINIPYPSQHIDTFIRHVQAFIKIPNIAPLVKQNSLEQNIACLNLADHLGADGPIIDTYTSEIARKLTLSETLTLFFNNPMFLNTIDQLHPNLRIYIALKLKQRGFHKTRICIIKEPNCDSFSASFSTDGKLFMIIGTSCEAHIYEVSTGTCIRTIRVREGNAIFHARLSPSGQQIVTYYKRYCPVSLWDVSTGELLHNLEGHTDSIIHTEFNLNDTLIATASEDKTARIWKTSTGKCILKLEEHAAPLTSVTFSPDGKLIATTSHDKTARIYETVTGKCLQILQSHTAAVNTASFRRDNKYILTASQDGTMRMWEIATEKSHLIGPGYHAAFHSDYRKIIRYTYSELRRNHSPKDLVEIDSGKTLRTFLLPNPYINTILALSPDGKDTILRSSNSGLFLCTDIMEYVDLDTPNALQQALLLLAFENHISMKGEQPISPKEHTLKILETFSANKKLNIIKMYKIGEPQQTVWSTIGRAVSCFVPWQQPTYTEDGAGQNPEEANGAGPA